LMLNEVDSAMEPQPEPQPEAEQPEVAPEPQPEAEQKEVAAQNPFQECVSAKIPKLLEEGKTQEEAVAIAISMCSEEKCSDVSLSTKEAIGNTEPNANMDTGNPHLELMKQQLILLGAIANKMDLMVERIDMLRAQLADEPKNQVEEEAQPEVTAPEPEEKGLGIDFMTKALEDIERAINSMERI